MSGSDLDIFSDLAKKAPATDPSTTDDGLSSLSAQRASAPPVPPSIRPSVTQRSSTAPPPPPSVRRNTLPGMLPPSTLPPSSRNSVLPPNLDPSEPLEVASFRWTSPPSSKQGVGGVEQRPSQFPGAPLSAPRPLSAAFTGPAVQAVAPATVASPPVVSIPVMPEVAARGSRTVIWVAIVAAVLGAVVAAVLLLRPTTGTLLITVSGPQQEALNTLQVFVDGRSVCTKSPCSVPDLPRGTHLVRAEAPGYTPAADQAIQVQPGNDNAQHIMLPSVVAKTGLRVLGNASLTLKIDGKQVGALPKDFVELAAGSHEVQISGSDDYQPYKENVSLAGGETRVIGPVSLKVLKGKLSLSAGANASGAKIELDGKPITLPASVELGADQAHQVTATKPGFDPFSTVISFADGNASRSLVIDLSQEGKAEPTVAPARAAAVTPASPNKPNNPVTTAQPASTSSAGADSKKESSQSSGQATLNINSIPASSVLINGRPVGLTPKIGVSVSPGSVTVTFIHPEQGRKTVTIDVPAGGTKTVTVRFP